MSSANALDFPIFQVSIKIGLHALFREFVCAGEGVTVGMYAYAFCVRVTVSVHASSKMS